MCKDSMNDWSFPYGKHWNDKEKIGDDLNKWAIEMRARDKQRANDILAEFPKEKVSAESSEGCGTM